MKKIVLIAFLAVFSVDLYAYDECGLSHQSMVLIAKVERHPARKLGYPYLISFNRSKDANKAYKSLSNYFIKKKTKNGKVGRSIDCRNESLCVDTLNKLIKMKITNLDLGGFQLNYKFHKLNKKHYFRVAESYAYACSYAQGFVDKYGPTFKSLAMYHSGTPKYRNKYAKRMYDEYTKTK